MTMNVSNPAQHLKISIPISGLDELQQYRKSIIKLLSKIEINDCNEDIKEDVKVMYKLLSHLAVEKMSSDPHDNLIP
jgi:hypothetical protein